MLCRSRRFTLSRVTVEYGYPLTVCTVSVGAGSYAEEYCRTNNVKYEIDPALSTKQDTSWLTGDDTPSDKQDDLSWLTDDEPSSSTQDDLSWLTDD